LFDPGTGATLRPWRKTRLPMSPWTVPRSALCAGQPAPYRRHGASRSP